MDGHSHLAVSIYCGGYWTAKARSPLYGCHFLELRDIVEASFISPVLNGHKQVQLLKHAQEALPHGGFKFLNEGFLHLLNCRTPSRLQLVGLNYGR